MALSAAAKTARAAMTKIEYLWGDPNGGGTALGCASVLPYAAHIDAIRGARGNERAALGATGAAAQVRNERA